MTQQNRVNDIVEMLDDFVLNGGGHMNIQVDDSQDNREVKVDVFKSTDCSMGNMACSVPTIHQGIDDEE